MGFCHVTHITNTILEDIADMSPVIQTETKTHCLQLCFVTTEVYISWSLKD